MYVYPVISRRSRGLSIGVNLNPDKACNFDCIYCQVDRTVPPRVRDVNVDVLRTELDRMLADAVSGRLFQAPEFAHTPASLRRLNDIAFSGDGEPTTCPHFCECVRLAADLKAARGAHGAQLILITDACYLTRPRVVEAMRIMDAANGRIWAKLDAGTEGYYRRVNKPNFPLSHVLDNIVHAARQRPVTIQALFMQIDGGPPPDAEIDAFCTRLNEMRRAGATFDLVQVYTVARRPAQPNVSALTNAQVEAIAETVRSHTQLPVAAYYASA